MHLFQALFLDFQIQQLAILKPVEVGKSYIPQYMPGGMGGTTGTSPGDFWEFDSFYKLKIRSCLKVPVVSKPWTKVKSWWFQKRSTGPVIDLKQA